MTVAELIAKHTEEGKSRYAIYHAAECEAWRGWYRSGGAADTRDPAYAYLAVRVAEQYHTPAVP